jgi:hypothetical protein
MTRITTLLAATLLASTAFAQIGATDPVQTNSLPFNAQSPHGDGVPITAQQAAAAANKGASTGLAKVFDEADTNRDNVVTKAEFMAKAERHFGMADTNKDGKITREEMQAQQNQIMQQMQQNLLGGNWQNKVNQFLGGTSGSAPAGGPTAPTAPTPPSVPSVR